MEVTTAPPATGTAIQMDRYGVPSVLQLREVTLPGLNDDEIRVRVAAAAVNRADIEIRSGNWPIGARNPFPYTPGLEAVGDVVQVGSAVREVHLGERVITMMQRLGGVHGVRPGGYQQFVTVRAAAAAVLPPGSSPLDIAALGLVAVTAYEGLARLDLQAGQTLLVHGASGGVGTAAVGIARRLGARVLATTSSPDKAGYLDEIGVDRVLDLRSAPLRDHLPRQSIDAVFDTLGAAVFADSVALLRRGGRLCLVGAATGGALTLSAWDLIHELQLTGYSSENLTGIRLRQIVPDLCRWHASGDLPAPRYECLPLADAAIAHQRMEQRTVTGRLLLIPDASSGT